MGKNLLADTDYAKGKDNRFRSSLMIGRVSEIQCDETQASVRVIFPDRLDHKDQPLITKPIPVLQQSAGKKRAFAMPRVGQNVLVAKLPNGTSDYLLLGTFYTTSDPPPVTDPLLDHTEYDDGSIIEFNASNGSIRWDLKGGINFQCDGAVTIQSDGSLLIDAPNIKLQGAMNFDGDITHTGNINTSGHHTDASGHHTSSSKSDDILARLAELERRVSRLETRA